MGKFFQRLIDFFYGIILLLVVAMCHIYSEESTLKVGIFTIHQFYIALQIIQVSIAISLIYRIFRTRKSYKTLIINKDNGTISISNTAIQDFIIKFLLRYDAISEVNCKVKLCKNKVTIRIQMHLDKIYRSSEFLQTLKNHLKKELIAIIGHQNKIMISYHINKIDLTRSELLQEIKPILCDTKKPVSNQIDSIDHEES